MRAQVTLCLSFASLGIVQLVSSSRAAVLRQQCWHERLLKTVNLLSSTNGSTEIIEELDTSATLPSSAFTSSSSSTQDLQDPVIDTTHFPWTHAPICTDFLPSINDKLCIYTNASFSKSRGISLFTTPYLANIFVSLPAFQSPSTPSHINTASGTWTTSTLPGRGVGMLASRNLEFKDSVTAYTPAFLAYLESELPTMERERFFRTAVQQLPKKTREMYEGLATVYGVESVKYQDVVKANTFQLEVGGSNHLAVFPETSRLNHDCSPNAQYVIDADELTHTVHVTRPIKKGEEITISYTSPLDPTPQRQSHLSQGFHFTCTCARCLSAPTTDATLSTISSLQAALNDWSPSSSGSPALAEQLLQLYRDEGLEGFMDVPYGFAALAWNAVGDREKAVRYAEAAREIVLLKDGRGGASAGLRIWEEVIADVEGHWSWRRRV